MYKVGPFVCGGFVMGVTCTCILLGGGGFFPLGWAGLHEMVCFGVSVVIMFADVCLCFCLARYLSEESCTGCCLQLGDARSCI